MISSAAALAQDQTPPLNPLAALDKATLKAFVEKPLFEPSRNAAEPLPPPVIEAPPPPPPIEQPPILHLIGIVEASHSLAAFIHNDSTGKTETLHNGDLVSDWKVRITTTSLSISKQNKTLVYNLFKTNNTNGPINTN